MSRLCVPGMSLNNSLGSHKGVPCLQMCAASKTDGACVESLC